MSDRESRKQELLKELGDVQSLLDDTETPSRPSPATPDALDRDQIRKLASELNQKTVIVKGELSQATGVERKNYWVIQVTSLRKAP